MSEKRYVVRLSDEERTTLARVLKDYSAASEKSKRAQILLKADVNGPGWCDAKIAEAVGCRIRTVENVRRYLVTIGFEAALERTKRAQPPTAKLLDGKQEAMVIATRLGPPPKGFANWSLRLLARELIALELVETVGRETVRRTLKKTALRGQRLSTG